MKLAMTTMVLQFLLDGPRPCTTFVLMFTLQLNILTGTFLLVSCFNTFQNLLWSVHCQRQKS